MTDPLHDARLRIDRASQQLHELARAIAAYLAASPFGHELQIDPGPEILLYALRIHRQPDASFNVVAGEIVQHLRSSLDYLVHQLVFRHTKAAPKRNKIQFPICADEAGFNTRGIRQNLVGVSDEAIALIRSLQPFANGEGKSSPLWHLREFSNLDKHRSLCITCAAKNRASSEMTVGQPGQRSGVVVYQNGFVEDFSPLFGRMIPAGPEPIQERAKGLEVKGSATLYLTFKTPEIDVTRPAVEILRLMGRRVAEIEQRIATDIFGYPRSTDSPTPSVAAIVPP